MSDRSIRNTSENMRRELDSIIKTVKDSSLKGEFISISRLELARDLSGAKIYVSTFTGIEKTKLIVKALKNAKGYIRGELSKRLDLRHTPELIFIPDDSIEYGVHMTKLIGDNNAD